MRASKFTGAQKAFIIKQGEAGIPVGEIRRKAWISQATYFNWKKRYGGLMPSELRRSKELQDENNRVKQIVAGLSLDRFTVQYRSQRKPTGNVFIEAFNGRLQAE